ncbi:hypothetical protein Poly21_19150 [Allorhodopirellula heiligendammensis]|uniref:Uncharacterized protein n=1 Tax=Allorhodopirellula heiligendammensis TaxID=2714739 RepID=A0A5C6C543_9BACT|nr:hypothetical protein Poly21_19150 [Allorhodopirellula heiligendammensis]
MVAANDSTNSISSTRRLTCIVWLRLLPVGFVGQVTFQNIAYVPGAISIERCWPTALPEAKLHPPVDDLVDCTNVATRVALAHREIEVSRRFCSVHSAIVLSCSGSLTAVMLFIAVETSIRMYLDWPTKGGVHAGGGS